MFALKYTCAALGLGIVACSASSPTVPPPPENNSVEVPPLSDPKEPPPQPQKSEKTPDDNIAASPPPVVKQPQQPPAEKPPECGKEKEPNNAEAQASVLEKCMTGELTGSQDVDVLKIIAPQGVTDMIIDHEETKGKVNYTVTIPKNGGDNGQGGTDNFNMSFSDKAPRTKVKPGQAYLFTLKWDMSNGQGNANDVRPWTVRVSFE